MKNTPIYNFLITTIVLILLISCGGAGGSGGGSTGGGGDALSDPVADALVSDLTVFVGEQISLDASGSTDPDGTIASWEWDMGDGESAVSGETQAYTYTVAGTYTVTLTVTDNDGNTNSVTVTVTVSDGSPAADAGGPYEAALLNTEVAFDGSASSDPNGSITDYSWNFGDGSPNDSGADLSGPSHTYTTPSTPGSYTVTLTVTDNDGNTDSGTANIRIHQAPVADAGGNRSAEIESTVNFDGSGSADQDSDGSIVSYAWDLDNNGSYDDAAGPTAGNSWSAAGTYTVGLQVVDNDGAIATDSVTVTVVEAGTNQPPTADAGGPYSPVLINTELAFDGSASSDSDGTVDSWSWDFDYDGSTHNGSSSEVNPSHTYGSLGEYVVHLVVTDDHDPSASDSDTATVIVHQKPTADINDSGNPTIVLNGESFTLSASDSQPDSGAAGGPVDFIAEYRWDFVSDGTVDATRSVPTVSHTYTTDGEKTVELTALDSSGELSDSPDTYTLTVHKAVVAEIGGPYFGSGAGNENVFQIGDLISLDASGSSDPDSVGDGTVSSFSWDFDYNGVSFNEDATGDTSTLDVSLSSFINTPGTYTMAVKVADPDDASVNDIDTLTYKLNAAPTADFDFSPAAQYIVGTNTYDVLTGEAITFDASGSSDSDGTLAEYVWDFDYDDTFTADRVASESGTVYSYTQAGTYNAALRVIDNDGADSAVYSATIRVADEEDVQITVQ
jgi:large repetitive protein